MIEIALKGSVWENMEGGPISIAHADVKKMVCVAKACGFENENEGVCS